MPILLNADERTGEYWEAEPICGKDFCDRCGECLYCYGDDECGMCGDHAWCVYADERQQWLADHPVTKWVTGV